MTARAVQGQRARAHRSDGRPRQLHVLSDGRHRRAGAAEAPQGARASAPRSAIPTTRTCRRCRRAASRDSRNYTQGLGRGRARPGLPTPVVRPAERINPRIARQARDQEKLNKLGAITEGGSTPAEFRAWLAKDLERWERVITEWPASSRSRSRSSRSQVRRDRRHVLDGQIGHRGFHELRSLAGTRAVLDVIELAHDIAGRAPGDRGAGLRGLSDPGHGRSRITRVLPAPPLLTKASPRATLPIGT